MEIKSIVKEICELSRPQRIEYIIHFLSSNNIPFNVHKYKNGTNIEVSKKGSQIDKDVIFFSHHDIMNYSYEGANDNTSSVAIMLYIAKHIMEVETYCNITIVFNDREEYLGALLSEHYSIEKLNKVISSVGSFQYLKNNLSSEAVLAIFIVELSGIGDSLYFATRSGNIECDRKLNDFLVNIANENKNKYLELPVAETDMISVNVLGEKGTVFGAIPYIEGQNYLNEVNTKDFNKDLYPHVWKKNHTSMDKYFAIQEKALEMVYGFIVEIINNSEKLTI